VFFLNHEKAKIFISYRRDDTSSSSDRLYENLIAAFGEENVFKDVYSIGGGDHILETIQQKISTCNVFLVVIGKRWMAKNANGELRLSEADDWVKLEIATALDQGKFVIPILVEGATMPEKEELPAVLQSVPNINAFIISQSHYRLDIKALIKHIKEKLEYPKPLSPLLRFSLIILLGIIAAFIFNKVYFNKFRLGDKFGGGIIYYIDSTQEHGLICSLSDLSSGSTWAQAIRICYSYRGGGFTDWHLPTENEILLLQTKKDLIGNFSTDCNDANFANCSYWSSTKIDSTFSYNLYFVDGNAWKNFARNGLSRVRAVRSF
jgi:hypothetical protein